MAIPLRKSPLCLAPAKAGFALAGLIPLVLALPAGAVEFSFVDGEVTGSLDTTLSYGQLYRVQGQDKTNDDTNGNDGNRNFDTGLVSEVFKITSDLEANYQNYGLFVRGTAFYDTQIMDKRNDNDDYRPSQSYPNNPYFTDETRESAGTNAEILDAYVYGNWDVGSMPLTVKVGRQVFNWGEGIFYRGGINTTNPIDAAKFRLPGSELKEVLVPVEAINFNIGLTDNLSLESFYQWNWKESAIDPAGTFFSETDLFADGGNTAYTRYDNPLLPVVMSGYESALAAGLVGNGLYGPNSYLDPENKVFKVANVGRDINAKNDGQYGFALRYVAEELNLTEFGFYFINYHAKEPQIAVDLSQYDGVDLAALQSSQGPFASAVATLDAAGNAVARREYVEDIRVYGFSFNTNIGEASVFGEIAYRPNLPVGISATNDLLGDLLIPGFFGETNIYDGNVPGDQACADISGKQLCRGPLFHNYERIEAFNLSIGTIYNFGPAMSFDSLLGVAELASEHARASDLTYTAYDGSERGFAGRPNGAYVSGYDDEDQLDRDAYGYTLALSGTWNDVYAGVNLSPFAVFKHNFQGNSHQTGNFVEGAMAYSVGLRASYLNSLEAEVQYTEYYGAGQNNSGRDRDNVGVNLKYSF
ncbi:MULTISPECIES: DUF1302 domain-containing protein [Pseudomonadaceae]|uniref:DUF1302 domain-containing protein n=1 Tax=Aquipseudomonas alcaligenes TaxID=43263 RepID=A0AA42SP67_AQUAC|nr:MULTISPECIES: DUF1302 domain-containing protein [Pseudomonas]AMR66612.1 glycine/betaine transmethylase [Pseudomonas alcaligenes]MDH0144711.1 DUF1302 domain-containing protein [Pseudomonas alcaligenes]MDH1053145.1 DUF1302 domain-containing protein [Pseudomonas alcaligenes]NMY41542.1 DUF1302 domain-containing protein [Pseudomonas sp. WS 5013]